MCRKGFRFSAIVVFFFATIAFAAEKPKAKSDIEAIEKVVVAAMEAMKKNDWKGFASHIHPKEIKMLREAFSPIIELASKTDREDELLAYFADAKDLKTLEGLGPQEFFVSFMKGTVSKSPQLKQALTGAGAKIIGTVLEGKDQAHVVCRMTMKVQGIAVSQVDVISLKRSGTEWKMAMKMDFRAIALALKRKLEK